MRLFLTVLWGFTILLLTVTSNFSGLMKTHSISINLNSQPNYSLFLEFPHSLDERYIVQKIGHILVFFLLMLLSRRATVKAGLFALSFALLTEILQLYTGRSGRLLDVGYDAIGILMGMTMVKIILATARLTEAKIQR